MRLLLDVFTLLVLTLALCDIQILRSRSEDTRDELLHAQSDLARANELINEISLIVGVVDK